MTADPLLNEGIRATEVDVEVLVVGAGISGIGAGIELRKRNQTSFVLLERAESLGGTWRDNTYPGIAVDIPSSSYCFSFETDFPWSRSYGTGSEILAYIHKCAQKYGIEEHIRYGSEVVRARFDEDLDHWVTELSDGKYITSRFLVGATGLFTTPVLPDIEGLEDFAGKAFHTARWNHEHDLTDRRVAIIGTGASAVQIIAAIADRVGHLTVFQRTPIWVSPRPDYPLPQRSSFFAIRRFAWVRRVARWASEAQLEVLTLATAIYRRFPYLIEGVQRLIRWWMRSQVSNPQTRAKLLPDYSLGCKRPAASNGYLQTFNRPNVDLVTQPIARIGAQGVQTTDGQVHHADTLVLATGFLTTQQGNAPAFDVVGVGEVELGQFWEDNRLQAYMGIAVPGFPNFFLTAGPYSGGFNWFSALEAHLGVMMDCMEQAWNLRAKNVEVGPDAHDQYMQQMWAYADGTIFKAASCSTANSYYIDRHGDASLPLPRTPWWRVYTFRGRDLSGFVFSAIASDPGESDG
jgi:cation diffusion facilitator CzcD-associated flavoprotein CzcO